MINSLYARLAIVLLVLFCVIGGTFLLSSLYTAHMYQQEITQRLNRDLAMYIVNEHVLIEDGAINKSDLKKLFHNVMIINPSLELYLLGSDGSLRAHSVDPSKVVRKKVSLEPINQMLLGGQTMPVLGEDPRSNSGMKAFSVFPIDKDGKRQGYIYAVLGSEQVENLTELLQTSYILRWSAGALGAALLFTFLAGLVVFSLMTRRLRKLGQSMEAFKQSGFSKITDKLEYQHSSPDEIDRMTQTFWEMAQRIQQQIESLKETDALRRELVANVSHDLRTPLSSLNGYLETLLLKDKNLSAEERRKYLEIAHRHSDRLSKLVIELFEIAKLDSNEVQPQKEAFSLGELVHDVIQKFQLRAEQQQVDFIVSLDEELPFVEADIGMIERVLDNLIDNSLKHTPVNGTIRINVMCDKEAVLVNVADTGNGISSEDLPHVFKRFYRMPGNDDTKLPGAGLGLAIAQRIVELHGGHMSVNSILDKGTVFDFDLPMYDFRHAA